MRVSRLIVILQRAAAGSIGITSATLAIVAMLGHGTASAGDLSAPTHVKAPAMVTEVYNWAGFHVGGNAGVVWERDAGTTNFFQRSNDPIFVNNSKTNEFENSAMLGGVHAGYSWQIAKWVFGVEADWDWTGIKNGFCRQTEFASARCADIGPGFLTLNQETEWLGSARVRLGFASDRILIYGTGGAAWGEIVTSINADCLRNGCGRSVAKVNTTANFSDTRPGWVAGAGIEGMLNANWIMRVEYLHYDLGNVTNTLNLRVDPANPQDATWTRSFRYDTVRVGLSYKFGGAVGKH